MSLFSCPNELISEIAGYLDSYSLKNLIETDNNRTFLYPVLFPVLWSKIEIELGKGSHLFWAAMGGFEEWTTIFLDNHIEVNARTGDRIRPTALHVAAYYGHDGVAKLLLTRGADIEAESTRGNPLYLATSTGHESMVRLLLERGAKVDSRVILGAENITPLHQAAAYGYNPVIEVFLEYGIDINVRGSHPPHATTALHSAVFYRQLATVGLLLRRGADPNIQGTNGITPLNIAVYYHGVSCDNISTSILSLLLEHGADTGVWDGRGTPLYWAAEAGNVEMVRLLVQNGSNVNLQDCWKGHGTPLHGAVGGGNLEVVKVLLESGADTGIKRRDGKTALLAALETGHGEIIRLLTARTEMAASG
ncbi:hypothetical protein Q9L58_007720 [Maublancomyces gigas]|uniref:Ankyrin repeat-containing domain protein n=1 Tax=Discina gigas TaxID=1032678 RepID=A0ABR3GBR1_9PEZI